MGKCWKIEHTTKNGPPSWSLIPWVLSETWSPSVQHIFTLESDPASHIFENGAWTPSTPLFGDGNWANFRGVMLPRPSRKQKISPGLQNAVTLHHKRINSLLRHVLFPWCPSYADTLFFTSLAQIQTNCTARIALEGCWFHQFMGVQGQHFRVGKMPQPIPEYSRNVQSQRGKPHKEHSLVVRRCRNTPAVEPQMSFPSLWYCWLSKLFGVHPEKHTFQFP